MGLRELRELIWCVSVTVLIHTSVLLCLHSHKYSRFLKLTLCVTRGLLNGLFTPVEWGFPNFSVDEHLCLCVCEAFYCFVRKTPTFKRGQ